MDERNADHHALEPHLFLLVGLNKRFALYDKSPIPRGSPIIKVLPIAPGCLDLSAAAFWEVIYQWHAMRHH